MRKRPRQGWGKTGLPEGPFREMSIGELRVAQLNSRESALLEYVQQLARVHGWLCYHTHDSRRSEAGFPDLVLANAFGQLYRELKKENEQPTASQREWLRVLTAGGADAKVWWPHDWEEIERTLEGRWPDPMFVPVRNRPPSPPMTKEVKDADPENGDDNAVVQRQREG